MVDYVSKWVEAMPCRKASTEESIAMIKSMIFPRLGTPRILISDGGTHFTRKNFKKCLADIDDEDFGGGETDDDDDSPPAAHSPHEYDDWRASPFWRLMPKGE
jgi:hypothetical protein